MQPRLRSYAATVAAAAALTVGFASCGSDSKSADTTEATVETTEKASTTEKKATTTEAAETTEAPTTIGKTTTSEAKATTSSAGTATTAAGGPTTSVVETDTGAIPDGWVAYTNTEGDYNAAFPKTPSDQSQTVPLASGSSMQMVIVSAQSSDGTFFGTARGEYPAGTIADVDAALQGAQDLAIQNVKGTLVASEDVELQGRPGRMFTASVSSNGQQGTLVQRVFLDGDTIYQNIVVGPGTLSPTDKVVTSFFNSFEFTA